MQAESVLGRQRTGGVADGRGEITEGTGGHRFDVQTERQTGVGNGQTRVRQCSNNDYLDTGEALDTKGNGENKREGATGSWQVTLGGMWR